MLGGAYFELYPSTGGAHLLASYGAILTTDGDATLVRIKKRSDIKFRHLMHLHGNGSSNAAYEIA